MLYSANVGWNAMGRARGDVDQAKLARAAADAIARAAQLGYDAHHKEERVGILLGRRRGRCVQVEKAITYRGGNRTRTAAEMDADRFAARVRALQKKHRMQFIGAFHTHNEVGGRISSALSPEDRVPLCDDPQPSVELVALVWASDTPLRRSLKYLQVRLADVPYRIRIAGYQRGGGFPLVPTYVGE